MRGKVSILLWFCLVLPFSVFSQITFEAKLSRDKLGLNENLQVEFVMNENGDNFIPPSFEGFRVVSGPSQSVSRQYINGVSSFSKSYSYFLQPNRKGFITIEQAAVTFEGEEYKTEPVTVQVTDAVERPNDPNNYQFQIQDNVHLVTHISNASPYINQGVLVEYKLYFQNPVNISDVTQINTPSYADFWSNNIDIGQIKVNPRGSYNGQPYNEVLWKKVLLYPQRSGIIELDPLVLGMTISVPTNRRDLFGSRIYNQVQENISTNPRRINVKELPLEGQPAGFSGAVGTFDFNVLANKTSLNASESLQIRVKVEGRGNLGLFPLPELIAPSNLEVFQPERQESINIQGSSSSGQVEDIYTIVSRVQGSYPIPSLTFSYFDPELEIYKMINSQEQIISVYGDPTDPASTISTVNQANPSINLVTGETKSFRFIKLNTSLESILEKGFWLSTLFWTLFLTPWLLMIIVLLTKKLLFDRKSDPLSKQQKTANRLAKKFLSAAKKQMNQPSAFYLALEKGLHTYLKAKFKIETIEFSKDKIRELLNHNGVDDEIMHEFIALLSNCEQARYGLGLTVNVREDFEIASRIMAQLDKQL
ncbi:MAG: BatD family protein [Flavobacteriaceae bacterium]|nr:BatD family protein [Flavobacteriaceae bacterium]MCY4215407.1 BatD family protein [Flavobacteriaceae bacterium]